MFVWQIREGIVSVLIFPSLGQAVEIVWLVGTSPKILMGAVPSFNTWGEISDYFLPKYPQGFDLYVVTGPVESFLRSWLWQPFLRELLEFGFKQALVNARETAWNLEKREVGASI